MKEKIEMITCTLPKKFSGDVSISVVKNGEEINVNIPFKEFNIPERMAFHTARLKDSEKNVIQVMVKGVGKGIDYVFIPKSTPA